MMRVTDGQRVVSGRSPPLINSANGFRLPSVSDVGNLISASAEQGQEELEDVDRVEED